MGHPRPRPQRLAEKLSEIRKKLRFSQRELVEPMGVQDQIHCSNVSKYETNKNEPPLGVLLAYARLTGVPIEFFIDYKLDLPK